MYNSRLFCAWLIVFGLTAAPVQANWMIFTGGGTTSTGVWPAGSTLSGTAVANLSNYVNGNNATLFIGLTPNSIGPNLSPDYLTTGLSFNTGTLVHAIATPYNDHGDKYHTVIDFSGTTNGSNPGVLPAGSIFSILDLDISENYRQIFATNAANNVITTPWINGPNGYFDATNPMTVNPAFTFGSSPTLSGPVAGVYDMFGVTWNDDAEMWLFKTTQDVKTISFDMEVASGGNAIGGGGAGWQFYAPKGTVVPEPTSFALICGGLVVGSYIFRSRRRSSLQ
jgi:hypothetical protein